MSEHKARISWARNSSPFEYQSYSRDHTWSLSGLDFPASAAPDYLGSESRADPEQAYVAALSSCHMLTFLAIAAKRRIVVESYIDEAVGYLEKDRDGNLSITRVVLKPRIQFAAGDAPQATELEKLHHGAHKNCFIASSVKTRVDIEI